MYCFIKQHLESSNFLINEVVIYEKFDQEYSDHRWKRQKWATRRREIKVA